MSESLCFYVFSIEFMLNFYFHVRKLAIILSQSFNFVINPINIDYLRLDFSLLISNI